MSSTLNIFVRLTRDKFSPFWGVKKVVLDAAVYEGDASDENAHGRNSRRGAVGQGHHLGWVFKSMTPREGRRHPWVQYIATLVELEEIYIANPGVGLCQKVVETLRVRGEKANLRLRKLCVELSRPGSAEAVRMEWESHRQELADLVSKLEVSENVALPCPELREL